MLTTRLRPEQLKEFEQKVQQTAMKFLAEVVRIRYSFRRRLVRRPCNLLRVLLSDDASRRDRLREIAERIERYVRTRYRPPNQTCSGSRRCRIGKSVGLCDRGSSSFLTTLHVVMESGSGVRFHAIP